METKFRSFELLRMEEYPQKVVMIQDGSEPVHCGAIRWALHGLMLKPGDSFILLGVLRAQTMPSFSGIRSFLGFMSKVDLGSRTICRVNQRNVSIEAARKKEYENNAELLEILKLYEAEKVEFRIEVVAGPLPKEVAVKSAVALKPTWVILDRKMKKDRKYFLDKLSCGIYRMKQGKSIKLLREPKAVEFDKFSTEEHRVSCVTYDEMMPGSPNDCLFSIELSPTYQAEHNEMSQKQELTHRSNTKYWKQGLQAEELLGNSICSFCNNGRPNPEWRRNFTYEELYFATDGFSMENNLSTGVVRYTYKGQLEMKLNVVVKQAKSAYSQEEADVISRIRDKNLLMLLGSSQEGDRGLLLVYEYACNCSLKDHLSKCHSTPLSWTQRIKIALGASRGLSYLHQNGIIHGNISSSNILLNHDFEPLLGGYWLAPMEPNQHSWSENVQNFESDFYSFGVLLLELITGQTVDNHNTLGSNNLVKSAIPLLNERRYLKLVDPTIANSHDIHQLYRIAQLAQKLLRKNPNKSLSMDEVISSLESIEDFPPMIKSNFSCRIEKEHEQEKRLFAWDIDRPFSITPQIRQNSGGDERRRRKLMRGRSFGAIQVHYGEMLT